MSTQFVASTDGTRIAYEVAGQGPALMLLHGAGQSRKNWSAAGYVEQLSKKYTVITVDMRGSGESQSCYDAVDYAIDKLCSDYLAVAKACGVQRFAVWGFSMGGTLARYLAVNSKQVSALVVVGSPLVKAASPKFDQYLAAYLEKWTPVIRAYQAGKLNRPEAENLRNGGALLWYAIFSAMKTWPETALEDIRCPALCVAGSQNEDTLAWIQANRPALDTRHIQVKILEGLTHEQEFNDIDTALPHILPFLKANGPWG